VKNNNDQFYEICRFLVEELLDGEIRHITVPPNAKLIDDHTVAKIGERIKHRDRKGNPEFDNIKRISNTESRKRVRPASPDLNQKTNSDDDDPNIDMLCSEIKFLRNANEHLPFNRTEQISCLQRAQSEVHQARKLLSDWALQSDVPSELAANIQILVCSFTCC
jgi:hypothetical protein